MLIVLIKNKKIKMKLFEQILKIKSMMGLINESNSDPEKYKDDKNYGYGEGRSMDQNIAKNKGLSNAKANLLSKQGKTEGAISGLRTVAEKTNMVDNQYYYIVAIQGTVI